MKKNLNIETNNTNLLNTEEFRSLLNFEAEYAGVVKGGHFPYYFPEKKTKRFVSDINILSSKEQKEIAYSLFTSKN